MPRQSKRVPPFIITSPCTPLHSMVLSFVVIPMNRPPQSEPLSSLEAFEAYYNLTPEQHDKPLESFALIGAKFNIPLARVKVMARKYQWAARKAARDQEVMSRIAERNIENAVETKMYYHERLHEIVRAWFKARTDDLELNKMTLAAMKPGDIRALIELDMDIMGHKDINDILKGVKEDEKDAKESVKILSPDELRSIIAIGDAAANKSKPVTTPSGTPGIGSA